MNAIGIIIITYNRPADVLDLLKSIATLNDISILLEEVIIFNNASTVDYNNVKEFIDLHKNIPFKYINNTENLGVSKGRNAAVKLSKAPLLFLIDDDTVFTNTDAFQNIIKIFNQNNNAARPLGIATIQIKYLDTNKQQITAFPHKNFAKYKDYASLKTYYYAGCAHIIKRSVFEKIGYLREDFFYGMEEYDFSYRAIDAGFCLEYYNSITILHKESPLGRKPRNEVLKMMWVNKTKVAYSHLPIKYFYTTAVLWSFFYLVKSKANIKGFLKGWQEIFKVSKTEKRKILSKEALQYIKSTEGRLCY